MQHGPQKRGLGLHLKLVVAGAATTFISITIVTSIIVYRQSTILHEEIAHSTESLRDALIERGSLLAESIAVSMENAVAGYDFAFVTETLRLVDESNEDLAYGYVANTAGSILAHTDSLMVGRAAPHVARSDGHTFRRGLEGDNYVEISRPIRVGGRAWGTFVMALDMAQIQTRARQARTRGREIALRSTSAAAAIGIAIALLGLTGSILLSRRLLRPINLLTQEALAIAEGNLDERIGEIDSQDEIGVLARQFERMRQSLHTYIEELVVEKQKAEDATLREQQLRSSIEDQARVLEDKVKERTAELQTTNERLTEYDRLKTEFLNNVSHELRSPLAAISSAAKIINRYGGDQGQHDRRFSTVIMEETSRLSRLINDLLDLSKIEAGGVDWNLIPIDNPADLIYHVIETFTALAEEHELELTMDVSPSLPTIRGDRDRLIQVVTNLCSNAVKFTPPGGQILVSAKAGDYHGRPVVEVSVTDTGRGIPDGELETIFDRFRQAGTGQEAGKTAGTGLGLAICREVVTYHDGTIWAETPPQGGARVVFVIPTSQPEAHDSVTHG